MKKYTKWIALFSQTGQEIIDISEQIQRKPDLIISNNHPSKIKSILKGVEYKWLTTFGKDSKTLDILDEVVDDFEPTIITLNGWLRIVPPDKCLKYNIYKSIFINIYYSTFFQTRVHLNNNILPMVITDHFFS